MAAVAAVECGSLLCQRDSFARSLNAVVVSCAETVGQEKGHGAYAVQLNDTVLFPEGGGQVWCLLGSWPELQCCCVCSLTTGGWWGARLCSGC